MILKVRIPNQPEMRKPEPATTARTVRTLRFFRLPLVMFLDGTRKQANAATIASSIDGSPQLTEDTHSVITIIVPLTEIKY